MSHFTVAVIGENPEQQLAPFQENNMSDCPQEYLEFVNVEEEHRNLYETDLTSEFYCNSSSSWGQQVSKENMNILKNCKIGNRVILDIVKEMGMSYFKLDKYYKCGYEKDNKRPEEYVWIKVIKIIDNNGHISDDVYFKGKIEVQVVDEPKKLLVKDVYKTFEDYMENYCGYSYNEENKAYGYYENPNAKWDWYELGGRWSGLLKLKDGTKGEIGSHGYFGTPAQEGFCDQAYKKDIDFEGMIQKDIKKAEERYDKMLACFDGKIPKIQVWEEFLKREDIDIEVKRELFYNQEGNLKRRTKLGELEKTNEELHSFLLWTQLDNFQCSKEEYIKNEIEKQCLTFAILKDGKWYERGEMGMWACISNEKDKDDFYKGYTEILDSVKDDELISIYDCHI